MIAANFDNFLFLLLVVVAVLFQLLAKMAGKKTKGQTKPTSTPRTPAPLQRAPTESDEDRIRKLLEALGQPPSSKPPPPIVPRINIPPRPLAPVQPPTSPLSQFRKEKSRKREAIPKETPPPNIEVHKAPLPIAPAPIFKAPAETHAVATQSFAKTEERTVDIAALLTSTSGLRDAVILREILGPPRGLRVIDAML